MKSLISLLLFLITVPAFSQLPTCIWEPPTGGEGVCRDVDPDPNVEDCKLISIGVACDLDPPGPDEGATDQYRIFIERFLRWETRQIVLRAHPPIIVEETFPVFEIIDHSAWDHAHTVHTAGEGLLVEYLDGPQWTRSGVEKRAGGTFTPVRVIILPTVRIDCDNCNPTMTVPGIPDDVPDPGP